MDTIKALTGEKIELVCEVGTVNKTSHAPERQAEPTPSDPSLSAISSIFGGGELLES